MISVSEHKLIHLLKAFNLLFIMSTLLLSAGMILSAYCSLESFHRSGITSIQIISTTAFFSCCILMIILQCLSIEVHNLFRLERGDHRTNPNRIPMVRKFEV